MKRVVKTEGNKRVSFTFDHKEKALEKAKALAKKFYANLIIQRSDGKIQKKYSYNHNRVLQRSL